MRVTAIIPARYASTRFPGKPLAMLGGKPVIQWVWEHVSAVKGIAKTVVATDDERIARAVEAFGGEAMLTSASHRSGTDRCGEVLRRLQEQGECYDIAINVQGDEPFVRASQLERLIECFDDATTDIATLRTAITSKEELFSPNNVKVVCDLKGRALYFSRQPLPYRRGIAEEEWLAGHQYYKHVGIYAFRSEVLQQVCQWEQTPLEQCESLEQLRWLENGLSIKVGTTQVANIGIDTPEDLDAAAKQLQSLEF